QREGLDAVTSGRLWSLAGLVATASGLLGGVLADRLGPSRALVVMFALEGAALALLAFGHDVRWFTLSALLYGVSLWGLPSAVTRACTALVGPTFAPAGIGLLVSFFAVGQAGGPVVAGLLAERLGSLGPGLLFGAAADLAGGIGAYWIRRDRPVAASSDERTA